MHRQFRKLLENATGISKHIIAVVLDIRGFTPFCQTVDSLDVATYVKKVYMKIIDDYFPQSSFYKPTGDGLLVVIPYDEKSLKEVANTAIESCLNLLEDFEILCSNEPMINFDTPKKMGIRITRGSACCITSEEKILDYSGKVLNLASRLMDIARPSGIVFDSNFGLDLLSSEKKELFLEDSVYVRGVAEEKPMTVYYTKNYTLISDIYKAPIKELKWATVSLVISLKKFKLLPSNMGLDLKSRPLDKNRIAISIKHDSAEGYECCHYYDLHDENIDYVIKGKEHMIRFEIEPFAKMLESEGAKDDTELRFCIDYPTK